MLDFTAQIKTNISGYLVVAGATGYAIFSTTAWFNRQLEKNCIPSLRNDQVATDIRLYLRSEIQHITDQLTRLQTAIPWLGRATHWYHHAGFHASTGRPAYYFRPSPYGLVWNVGSWPGTTARLLQTGQYFAFGSGRISRNQLSNRSLYDRWLAGFSRPSANSLDSVSDRDFAIEFTAVGSIIMMHLSRFSEEFNLVVQRPVWFYRYARCLLHGFIDYCPQKKNPDVPELVRGKSGRVTAFNVTADADENQPLAYNKDIRR